MVVLSNNSYETKFLDAAKKGDLNRIKEMTSKKEKKVLISLEQMDEIKDENGATAFYWASRKGHLNIVQFFIENAPSNANVNGKDKYGATALHAASWDGHVNVIEYLLDNGANVNQQNDSGSTALHYASSFRGKSKSTVLKLLLQNGADPYIPNKHNKTAIDLAKRAGGHDVIIQHIQQQQQQQSSPDVNNTESTNAQPPNNTRPQPSSSTPTSHNQPKRTNDEPGDSMSIQESRNLLQHAIDHPESTDNISDLPYQYILNNQDDETNDEVDKDDDKDENDKDKDNDGGNEDSDGDDGDGDQGGEHESQASISGFSAMTGDYDMITEDETFGSARDSLGANAAHQDSPKAKMIMVPTSRNKKQQFLIASEEGNLKKIHELTREGSFRKKPSILLEEHDEIQDDDGRTALIRASARGQLEVVKFLLQQKNVNVNGMGKHKDTALHGASWNGHDDVLEFLLGKGANVDQRDENGHTALHIASS